MLTQIQADDIMATIKVMRLQEETSYQCGDYLSLYQSNHPDTPNGPLQSPVDASCRFKMAEWCGQLIDYCSFEHETVEIAMSLLDRYCMSTSGQQVLADRRDYQLASMTCLYTAVKVFEPEAMDPTLIARLSRGTCTEEDIEDMERDILMTLNFRINCPTATAFASHFLALLPAETMPECDKKSIMEVVKQQIQHAVNRYEFIEVKSSTIALLALSNALACCKTYCAYEDDFVQLVTRIANIDRVTRDEEVQLELYTIVAQAAPYCTNTVDISRKSQKLSGGHSSPSSSPRSVWSSKTMHV